MNTRQKLTLGIAAIFMVTLTIVGVTYAYFFTRVENVGDDQTDVTASTATISSIEYWEDENTDVELNNILPGTPIDGKVFGAYNPNEAAGTFRIALTNTPGTVKFLHSSDDLALTSYEPDCYKTNTASSIGNDVATDAKCYEGAYYDNIVFTLYEEDGTTLAEDDKGNTFENVKVKYQAVVNGEQFLTDASGNVATFTVAAGETNKYVLKVSYLNKTTEGANNQNLEFDAELTIRVTIK